MDPLNSVIFMNILGTQTWTLYHKTEYGEYSTQKAQSILFQEFKNLLIA